MIEYSMFNRLPAGSQVAVLGKEGTVVAKRLHKGYNITLYSINNYFVELWRKENFEIIGSFHRSVSPLTILEPYLDVLEVPDLSDIM